MQKLLFLHGALGSSQHFQLLITTLGNEVDMNAIDFSGHGKNATIDKLGFGIQQFGQDVISWMDKEAVSKADIFGYSMGGYVALWLALNYPERIGKVMTLATKFAWTIDSAEKEARLLNPEKIKEKVPAFAAQLAVLHGDDRWQKVITNTAKMMLGLGANPLLKQAELEEIKIPVRVMVGDHDNMVSLEETIEAFRYLPNAQLCVLPETQHPIEKVSVERLALEIRNFFF